MEINSVFLTHKKWETDFFGKDIWTLDQLERVTNTDLNEFNFVCKKIAANDYFSINRLMELEFKYVEGEITLVKSIDLIKDNIILEFTVASNDDIDDLTEIARNEFEFTRFREPWFSNAQKNSFYELWLKKSVLGTFDDVCLLIKERNIIKGFVTLKKLKEELKIGLLAVSIKHQGQGVGRLLMKAAENYAVVKKCRKIYVATQLANEPAINLYLKSGYSLSCVNYWFYREVKENLEKI